MFWGEKLEKAPWKPEWEDLASYNSESRRDVMFSDEWKAKMAEMQKDFNREQEMWAHRNGFKRI